MQMSEYFSSHNLVPDEMMKCQRCCSIDFIACNFPSIIGANFLPWVVTEKRGKLNWIEQGKETRLGLTPPAYLLLY